MINIFNDIWQIIRSLSFIDYILYFAVVTLIVLVVSLVYVIQMEKEENIEELENNQTNEEEYVMKNEVEEEIDLQNIVNIIDENPQPLADMTAYEEEQESKAIISYDELIKESDQSRINYTKEEMIDDVIPVKRITLNSVETDNPISFTPKEPKIEFEAKETSTTGVKLFSYEKEEAFLKALKQLNELLN